MPPKPIIGEPNGLQGCAVRRERCITTRSRCRCCPARSHDCPLCFPGVRVRPFGTSRNGYCRERGLPWYWSDPPNRSLLFHGGVLSTMRYLFLLLIRLYWFVWPRENRRTCLFRESCSRHVYRTTKDLGLVAGALAFGRRLTTCRPGYFVSSTEEGTLLVHLVDGTILSPRETAPWLLDPVQSAASAREAELNTSFSDEPAPA